MRNLSNWKDIAELIGITAIVASLLFVGLQMKQSQDIAVADQYQDRADAALDYYVARMQSESALEVVAQGLTGSTHFESSPASPAGVKLTAGSEDPIILAQKYLEFRANVTMFDNYHFQYQQGFLQEEAWQAFRVRIKIWLSNNLNAELYRQQANQYRQSFQNLCDDLLIQNAEVSR